MGSADFLLVGGLFTAAFAVYSFVSAMMSTGQAEKDILSWASGSEPIKSKSAMINWSRPLVHQFTLKYALLYRDETYRKKLSKLILTSGLSKELNVDEFLGMQIFWGVMIPVVLALLNFALEFHFPIILFISGNPSSYG